MILYAIHIIYTLYIILYTVYYNTIIISPCYHTVLYKAVRGPKVSKEFSSESSLSRVIMNRFRKSKNYSNN